MENNTNQFMDKNLLHLFHPVVVDNSDDVNFSFYVDQTQQLAFAGFRRSWGLGDLFARYIGPIKPFDWSENYGVYSYSDNTFQTMVKLPGKPLPTGGREEVSAEDCDNIFNTSYQQVAGHHQLVVNPKQVLDWIRKRTVTTSDGVKDRVMNIQGFKSVNLKGQFAAKIELYEGRQAVVFNTPKGIVPLFIDAKSSLIHTERLSSGDWVVVQPIGIVEGYRLAKILRLHEPGVRMAIQHLKGGMLMPGDPRHSLHESEDGNNIMENDINTFPFISGQQEDTLKSAPMLSIQLDTLERALKALSGHKRVELLYKNSYTPVLFVPIVKDGEPRVEVVASAFSQYKSGKVVTQ